ncbi:hypothetical protein M422DRAFT_40320 [Sphaerobolus stellatus SS14]|nr:hypothetical protein M422DRAFT_40320 [Sphaerobolus stellatus SS14]
MPQFCSPFGRSDRNPMEYSDPGSRSSYSDSYAYNQRAPPARTGSRWRTFLGRRDRNREPSYASYAGGPSYTGGPSYVGDPLVADGYTEEPSMMGPIPTAMPSPHRTAIDDYSESGYSNPETRHYARQSMDPRYTPSSVYQGSMVQEQESYPGGPPSREPLLHEGEPIPSPMDHMPMPEHFPPAEPSFTEPSPRVYANSERLPSPLHENPSLHSSPYSSRHGASRRIRTRGGERIDVGGGVRLEVDDQGHRGYRSRRGRSRSRSVDSYDSESSGRDSYTSSSSVEPPVRISADPHMPIEIGNERDGFVPYQDYLAHHEARRRTRKPHRRSNRHRRHDTSEDDEQVYIVPPGANVIFVDEDGREIHRVGDIDERRYPPRRRSSRPIRDDGSSSLSRYYSHGKNAKDSKYVERAVQTEAHEGDVDDQPMENNPPPKKSSGEIDEKLMARMKEAMKAFANSRSSSPVGLRMAMSNNLQIRPGLPHTLASSGIGSPPALFRPLSPRPIPASKPLSRPVSMLPRMYTH